jgi:hypothetical protein
MSLQKLKTGVCLDTFALSFRVNTMSTLPAAVHWRHVSLRKMDLRFVLSVVELTGIFVKKLDCQCKSVTGKQFLLKAICYGLLLRWIRE